MASQKSSAQTSFFHHVYCGTSKHNKTAMIEGSMLVGVPKEIKNHEYRVGLTPAAVKEFITNGHSVVVETNAGTAIGFTDEMYIAAGAHIAATAEEIFAEAEMIVKVKEPQPNECKMLRKGQTLYTYLHLAPDPVQTELLIASGAT